MQSKTNQKYHNFTLKVTKELPQINLHYREFIHKKSQAQLIHLEADDPENLFSLCFSTHPQNSSGVAHILEHTVLCGSEKYPVKDPFFSLSRRSLNTFMNAMTGSDFTCYPASSCLEKDFFNLLNVYLDAVFNPLLNPLSFLQEGHRLEWKNKQQLEIKGIVFNEMKGAMNSGMARLWQGLYQGLFPQLTYRHNSGGDPLCIPKLSYKQLLAFHKKFYHPSRCLFFFYGNIPPEKILQKLDNGVLKDCRPLAPLPPLPAQKRFLKPKRKLLYFPSTTLDNSQNLFSISFLTCPVKKQEHVTWLQLLSIALMGNDASPLKKPLLDSKLCSDVFVTIDDEVSEVPVMFIFKGVEKKNISLLESFFFETLKKLHQEGIPKSCLDLALHQMEFSALEIQKGRSPYGLKLFYRSALLRQHGVVGPQTLMPQLIFKKLKSQFKTPSVSKRLLKRYFIDNPHRLSLTLLPDTNLEKQEEKQEKALIKKIQSQLKAKEKKAIKDQALALKHFQEEEEDLELLPKVTLKDIKKSPQSFPLKKPRKTLYTRSTFTQGISYANLYLPLPHFSLDQAPYVNLFISLLPELGWGKRNYNKHLSYLQTHLGNLTANPYFIYSHKDPKASSLLLHLSAKCLQRKHSYLINMFESFFHHVDFFDKKRIKELITQHYSHLSSSISQMAMGYAKKQALCSFSTSHTLQHHLSGLPYLKAIQFLYHNLDTQLEILVDFFHTFYQQILSSKQSLMLLSSDEKALKYLSEKKLPFLKKPLKPQALNISQEKLKEAKQGFIIPSQVAFSCYAIKSIPLSHPDSIYLSLCSELMDNLVLHKRIREQGGAYGSGSRYEGLTASFSFYAYRDPQLSNTLNAFEEALESIGGLEFSQQQLEEAKLGIFQGLDAPLSPGAEGPLELGHLLSGISKTMRKERREKLLKASPQDIKRACNNYLKPYFKKGAFACFASQNFFDKHSYKIKTHKL